MKETKIPFDLVEYLEEDYDHFQNYIDKEPNN